MNKKCLVSFPLLLCGLTIGSEPVTAQEVTHEQYCFIMQDVLPPPADSTNPIFELRFFKADVLLYNSDTYGIFGVVLDPASGIYSVTGTASFNADGAIAGTLTGVIRYENDVNSLADYKASFVISPATLAGAYSDNQTPSPFGTDRMIMVPGDCSADPFDF